MQRAAVVLPLVRTADPAIVFVRRAAHLRRNPGQIGFPGGLLDDGEDERTAALREFEEELGMPRARVRLVDRLDDVITLALNVTVTPFVGVLDPPVAFAHDAAETESVHEVPLAALYVPGALHAGEEPVERAGRHFVVHTWLFDYAGLHVWGATARMLRNFVTRYPDLAAVPLG